MGLDDDTLEDTGEFEFLFKAEAADSRDQHVRAKIDADAEAPIVGGKVRPTGLTPSIDLHGDDAERAERRLREFVRESLAARAPLIRVIHGQGRRSPGPPVLLKLVDDWCRVALADRKIVDYSAAPARFGGDGATLIWL